jgi:hypothetical protein
LFPLRLIINGTIALHLIVLFFQVMFQLKT